MSFKISAARLTRALINKRGFTLVELLIVLVILSIVLAMIYQFFGFSNKMFKKTDDLGTKQDQARLIVQGLRKDLGTALSVAIVDSDLDYVDAPADSYALYVKDDQLVREDETGSIKPIYSNAPVQNFRVVFPVPILPSSMSLFPRKASKYQSPQRTSILKTQQYRPQKRLGT